MIATLTIMIVNADAKMLRPFRLKRELNFQGLTPNRSKPRNPIPLNPITP